MHTATLDIIPTSEVLREAGISRYELDKLRDRYNLQPARRIGDHAMLWRQEIVEELKRLVGRVRTR